LGGFAGVTGQQLRAVALGYQAGQFSQGESAIAIGYQAGQNTQGFSSIAIGTNAGQTSQHNNTIILNARGLLSPLNSDASNSFYVAPIRTATQTTTLGYNTTTSEITYYNMTGPGTVTTLAASGTSQTLTANFGSFYQGTSVMPTLTLTSNNIATTIFAFTGGIDQGTYTIILPFTGTANTITINAVNSGNFRCNFTTIAVTLSGANTRRIILSVVYDSSSSIYFISGSTF
jgi:hypothetical protein